MNVGKTNLEEVNIIILYLKQEEKLTCAIILTLGRHHILDKD